MLEANEWHLERAVDFFFQESSGSGNLCMCASQFCVHSGARFALTLVTLCCTGGNGTNGAGGEQGEVFQAQGATYDTSTASSNPLSGGEDGVEQQGTPAGGSAPGRQVNGSAAGLAAAHRAAVAATAAGSADHGVCSASVWAGAAAGLSGTQTPLSLTPLTSCDAKGPYCLPDSQRITSPHTNACHAKTNASTATAIEPSVPVGNSSLSSDRLKPGSRVRVQGVQEPTLQALNGREVTVVGSAGCESTIHIHAHIIHIRHDDMFSYTEHHALTLWAQRKRTHQRVAGKWSYTTVGAVPSP